MLADYSTLKAVFSSQFTQLLGRQANSSNGYVNLPLNYVWLRTRDDARSLASVRAALNSAQLGVSNLFDRRDIIDELQHDPLSFTILLMLSIGGVAALALALVGDLVASWLSVRMRRGNFVVLRALGANARQVAALLLWEQALVYVTALALRALFGMALVKLAVPVLVFTGLPAKGGMSELSTSSFYLLQQIIPVQVVVPLSIRLAFVGLALLLMVRVARGPSVIRELRLNED